MRLNFLILILLLQRISSAAIFGEDKRYYNSEPDGAFASIGRINGCGGTLIDKDLVLTARHCMFDESNKLYPASQLRTYVFEPGATGGTSDDLTAVEYVYWLGGDDRGEGTKYDHDQDWAILKLKDEVGNKYGWMEIKPFIDQLAYTNEDLAQTYISAGYPGDRDGGNTLSIHDSCKLYQEDWKMHYSTAGVPLTFFPSVLSKAKTNNYILTDCPAVPGSSGGPIFRMEKNEKGEIRPFIYAMITGAADYKHYPEFVREKGNAAATTGAYFAQYQLIKTNPQEREKPTRVTFDFDGYPVGLPEPIVEMLTKNIPAKVNASANRYNETEHTWLKSRRQAREKKSGLTLKGIRAEK